MTKGACHAQDPARPLLKPATASADFDFLMGIWRCRHRYRVRRLAGCNDWIEFDGTCAARKILAGFGNTDENDIGMPGGRYTGISLRLWDPDSEQLDDPLARQPPARRRSGRRSVAASR